VVCEIFLGFGALSSIDLLNLRNNNNNNNS